MPRRLERQAAVRCRKVRVVHGQRCGDRLRGVRGRPPADMDALADALVNLSRFAAANADKLSSVDLNPFVVLPEGKGAVALDALVVPKI